MPCYFGGDDDNPHGDCYRCDDCGQPICAGDCSDPISGPHGCRCDEHGLYFCLICQRSHVEIHRLEFSKVFPSCGGTLSGRALDAAIQTYLATDSLDETASEIRTANLFLNTVSPGGRALETALQALDDEDHTFDEGILARTGKPFVRLGAEFFGGGTQVRLALLAAHEIGIAYQANFRFRGQHYRERNLAANAFARWVNTGVRPDRGSTTAWVAATLGPAVTDKDKRRHTRTVQWLDSVFLEVVPDAAEIATWFVADVVPV